MPSMPVRLALHCTKGRKEKGGTESVWHPGLNILCGKVCGKCKKSCTVKFYREQVNA